MLIDHPLLGLRDSSEFIYMGDAKLLERPNWKSQNSKTKFIDYGYLRKILRVYTKNSGTTSKVIDLGLW